MLAHLVYVSARKRNCTDEEIEKILEACKVNNGPLDITGVLLYSDTKFIQYVEGKPTALLGLYDKIKKDSRHEKAVMISYNPITKRIFPSWQMGSLKFTSDDISFITDITEQDKDIFQKVISGTETDGTKVRDLLVKFFKK